jgi:phenylalanyl-tRNA synthetase alpha chain
VAAGRAALTAAGDLDELRAAEQAHLSRRSPLGEVQRGLGALGADSRRELGRRVNQARTDLQAALASRRAELETARDAALLEAERVDVTLPGRRPPRGAVHPLTSVADEVIDIFVGLGYRVFEGPEVETDWYNFEALNFPPGHPARSMQDSLTLVDDRLPPGWLVLRTHTSPGQIRAMQAQPPPLYVVVPGRCYRADTPDATHVPVFNQIELLAVAEGLTMGDMKGTLLSFARSYFGEEREIRLRPSYFPFVEPGAEMDLWFPQHRDGPRWVEWGGCGMVHPRVLRACGIDPQRYSGFAFGMGIERTLMFRHGISDMRDMVEGDVRFARAFGMEV